MIVLFNEQNKLLFLDYFQLLKKAPGQISFPLDFRHKITVLQTGIADEANLKSDTPPPGSPALKSRLKAIARE